jgi:hypothetical protein
MTHWRVSRAKAVTRAVRQIKDGGSTGVNTARKAAICATLTDHPEGLIGRRDVVAMFGIHRTLASTLLSELVSEGLLDVINVGRRRYYRLKKRNTVT